LRLWLDNVVDPAPVKSDGKSHERVRGYDERRVGEGHGRQIRRGIVWVWIWVCCRWRSGRRDKDSVYVSGARRGGVKGNPDLLDLRAADGRQCGRRDPLYESEALPAGRIGAKRAGLIKRRFEPECCAGYRIGRVLSITTNDVHGILIERCRFEAGVAWEVAGVVECWGGRGGKRKRGVI